MRSKDENKRISIELYSMKLLEWKIIEADGIKIGVTRVPGGWIFENFSDETPCFVPYSEEFL